MTHEPPKKGPLTPMSIQFFCGTGAVSLGGIILNNRCTTQYS